MVTPDSEVHGSDLELARAVAKRDRKATARLVEIHTDAVYQYVWRRLAPNVDMVDDLVQDIFVAAWRSIKSYLGRSPLRAWLIGIARNKVEDHYRRVLNHPLIALEGEQDAIVSEAIDPQGEIESIWQAEQAESVLQRLPDEYAAVLRWRYWDDRSAREMAAATGKTEKAIERLLARAREQFRLRWLAAEGEK